MTSAPAQTQPYGKNGENSLLIKERNGFVLSTSVSQTSLASAVMFKAVFWLQCLSDLPHDPALSPSVDPSISLIPPVNVSSSYYDGMFRYLDQLLKRF
jgi:hypothetical protein